MKLYKKTSIYILAPSNIATGGPEALHQLGYVIKNFTPYKKIFMNYYPTSRKSSVHSNYKSYNLKTAIKIIDKKENLLIIPEISTFISLSKKYKHVQKCIWWLSLDNYIISYFESNNHRFFKSLIKLPYKLIYWFNKFTIYNFGNITFNDYLKFLYIKLNFSNIFSFPSISGHFTQSLYVKKILNKKKLKTKNLSDYLKDDFLFKKSLKKKNKNNLIAYNPTKSTEFMKEIIKSNTNKTFLPLVNLTKKEVIKTLKKTKIYFDFGTHPGKDRIPREAAILGNCIITNKNGSAKNNYDLSISSSFKFTEKKKNLKNIKIMIEKIFAKNLLEQKKFNLYIKKIYSEKKIFIKEVQKIFK